jgi:hypothetical protein
MLKEHLNDALANAERYEVMRRMPQLSCPEPSRNSGIHWFVNATLMAAMVSPVFLLAKRLSRH